MGHRAFINRAGRIFSWGTRYQSSLRLTAIALLVGLTLTAFMSLRSVTPDGTKPLPMMGKSSRTELVLTERVELLVREALATQQKGGWYEGSGIGYYHLIANNPLIKRPEVSISCGNSVGGVFDIAEARKLTEDLFSAYGIPLETHVPLKGEGYAFTADGYNRELNVGFEIRSGYLRGLGWNARWAEQKSGADFLGHDELVSLERDVKHNRIAMFVCDPNEVYDGDEYLAMSYYLASVIDYLNWIHGDREVDYSRILDDTKKISEETINRYAVVRSLWAPSADVGEGASPWTVDHGEWQVSVADAVTTLVLNLDAGATASYRPIEMPPYLMAASPPWDSFRFTISRAVPDTIPFDIDVCLNGKLGTRVRKIFMPGSDGIFDYWPHYEETDGMDALQSLSITNVNSYPLELHLTRVEKLFP